MRAISKIKKNPKFFYSYAKKLSKTKKNISQLLDTDGNLKTDRKDIEDILQKQFESSFSNPNNPDTVLPPTTTPNSSLLDFSFTCEDFIKAIDEVHASSSSPDFSVPAIVLKKCKYSLAKPLYLMWKESLNTGTVPAAYKSQLVTPVFKKGSQSKHPITGQFP